LAAACLGHGSISMAIALAILAACLGLGSMPMEGYLGLGCLPIYIYGLGSSYT